jgi:hypothetical protein
MFWVPSKLRNRALLQDLSQIFGSEQADIFFCQDFQQKVITCKIQMAYLDRNLYAEC